MEHLANFTFGRRAFYITLARQFVEIISHRTNKFLGRGVMRNILVLKKYYIENNNDFVLLANSAAAFLIGFRVFNGTKVERVFLSAGRVFRNI